MPNMPPKTFLLLILSVIVAAGITIALWAGAGLPLIALGSAALLGSWVLGWKGFKRGRSCPAMMF
jgi:hypothetical protein